ncbi:three-helix bundle dimerization domain-containing protein [Rhodococcus sp. NPDC127528]|uniref:three-helix bundle dimerization domain-containing protein n=1 Tax=unclassified Rhodococcus (in: high G+C Gram-positive bacteria) TaxID=192944 RepID=UPI00363E71B1
MPADDEERHIEFVVERLTRKHPNVPAATVRAIVAASHTHFAGRRVRDFVPLLVERNAEAELNRTGPRDVAVGADAAPAGSGNPGPAEPSPPGATGRHRKR